MEIKKENKFKDIDITGQKEVDINIKTTYEIIDNQETVYIYINRKPGGFDELFLTRKQWEEIKHQLTESIA